MALYKFQLLLLLLSGSNLSCFGELFLGSRVACDVSGRNQARQNKHMGIPLCRCIV